jgi:uncharacterized membrane protein
MGYAVGIGIALVVSVLAHLVGLDRDRAFYPTLLFVIASYYVLFAVMGGSTHAMLIESIVMMAFGLIAIIGFKFNLWFVVGALAAHGIFDFFHGHVVTNPGVPAWWPAFCLAYDVAAAAFLAWLVVRAAPSRQDSSIPAAGSVAGASRR